MFKKKFRDFFTRNSNLITNNANRTEYQKRKARDYSHQNAYPEDLKINKRVEKYMEEMDKHDPNHIPYDKDEPDPRKEMDMERSIDPKDVFYGMKTEYF